VTIRLGDYHARALVIAAARPRMIRAAVRGVWDAGRRGWCRCWWLASASIWR